MRNLLSQLEYRADPLDIEVYFTVHPIYNSGRSELPNASIAVSEREGFDSGAHVCTWSSVVSQARCSGGRAKESFTTHPGLSACSSSGAVLIGSRPIL